VALLALIWACSSGPPPPDDRPYEAQIEAWRRDKDAVFRSTDPKNTVSPIPVADRPAFKGIAYFPIDPSYRVPAYLTLESTNPPVIIQMQTTADERDTYRKVGWLGFSIHGTEYKLTAYASREDDLTRLFVPFGDLTNGEETYKGGRFLELDRTATGLYDLDFNRAYHPFCVFNPSYICPVPPRENRLPVAIRAGEKLIAH
jgi:uncharacterized protein (DUF1684 family)